VNFPLTPVKSHKYVASTDGWWSIKNCRNKHKHLHGSHPLTRNAVNTSADGDINYTPTQDDVLDLLLILPAFDEEGTRVAVQQVGFFDGPEHPLIPEVHFELIKHGDVNSTKDFRFDINGASSWRACLHSQSS
jgi:hypothetical protein